MSNSRLRIQVKRPIAVPGPYSYEAINLVLSDLNLNHVLSAESIRTAKQIAKSLIFIHSGQGRQLIRRITKTKSLKRLQHLPKLPECPRPTYFFAEKDDFEYKFLPAAAVVDMEVDGFNLDELALNLPPPTEPSSDFCSLFKEAVCLSDNGFWIDSQPLDPIPFESLDDILERALVAPEEEHQVPLQLQQSEERQYLDLQPLVEPNYEADDEADVEQGRGALEEAELLGVTFGEYVDRWHSENAIFKVLEEFPTVSPPMDTNELGLEWNESLDLFLQ